jgi:hypothetical protein
VKVLLIFCTLVAGCATAPPSKKPAPLGPGEIVSARAAQDLLEIGKTTKDDVRAALGQATVVDFASGYEVWVYREPRLEKASTSAAELVLLFEPSGLLSKTRVR